MMDGGLHHRAIQPQLVPFRHLGLPGQHNPVQQRLKVGRLHRVRPAEQGPRIGHPLQVHPTEPSATSCSVSSSPRLNRCLLTSIRRITSTGIECRSRYVVCG